MEFLRLHVRTRSGKDIWRQTLDKDSVLEFIVYWSCGDALHSSLYFAEQVRKSTANNVSNCQKRDGKSVKRTFRVINMLDSFEKNNFVKHNILRLEVLLLNEVFFKGQIDFQRAL